MRTLIALFACSLVVATASANDPTPASHAAAASSPAEAPKAAAPAAPASIKPSIKPPLSPEAQRAREEQAEAELSAKIAARLAVMRANQAARVAAAAKAKKASEAKRKEEAVVVATPPPVRLDPNHWSYEGESGPANWAKINPEWSKCGSGNRQSPIDIRDGMKVDLEQIAFDYKPSAFNVVDNGHTVQVTVGGGNYITVQNRSYELVQFHFHRPSEERINGKSFEMVVHLVHKDAEGKLAVLAVLLERGKGNSAIQTVWNNLPLEKGDVVAPSIVLDVAELLPEKRDYFTYMGSLTTPPCSEGV
ncbi:MAG: carbonic anhydrase family protein, partial [Massilia sp.]